MSFSSPSRVQSDYGWRPPTTYVDVLFLILCFFITVSSFRDEDRQIDVALPTTETQRPPAPGKAQIVITVTSDGRILMGDQPYTMDSLRATMAQLASQFPNESLLIRGDRESKLGVAVRVMDEAQRAGIRNVYLATSKPPSEAGQP